MNPASHLRTVAAEYCKPVLGRETGHTAHPLTTALEGQKKRYI